MPRRDPHESWIDELKKEKGQLNRPSPKKTDNPKDKNKK